MAENHLDLHAREVRAHTEMLAEPEREVWVRSAVDAEAEGVVEHVFVAVRRREVQRELVAGADLRVSELTVLGGDAREVADRAHPTQDLLDRVSDELASFAQHLPLFTVLAEGEEATADRVACRLVTGLDEQLAVRQQLRLCERLAVDGAAEQLAHEIVAGVAPTLLDQARQVAVQLAARAFDR